MSNQKNFRSEESRRNYQKAERQRARDRKAKERYVQRRAQREKLAAWLKQHSKKLIIAAAVIAVLILLWQVVPIITGVAGSIPNYFGTLHGTEENWLIINTAPDKDDPRYYHLADFDIPAGYTRDDYSVFKDGVQQDFFCIADSADVTVQDVYVTAARDIVAAEYPYKILSYNLHWQAGEPHAVTVNGMEGYCIFLISNEIEGSGEGMGISYLSYYFDTDKGACVIATFRSATMPYGELPDEATMIAAAEPILSGLTLVK
ncbi:MAG: hypothetical protein IKL25_08875 [Clostridia bacterium]|nr:hypothetical protein [Clostridia bacterium]